MCNSATRSLCSCSDGAYVKVQVFRDDDANTKDLDFGGKLGDVIFALFDLCNSFPYNAAPIRIW